MTTTEVPQGAGDEAQLVLPLELIGAVVEQICDEAGLAHTSGLEELAVMAFIGLLDSSPPQPVTRERLLARCRKLVIVRAWEQGRDDEPGPVFARR